MRSLISIGQQQFTVDAISQEVIFAISEIPNHTKGIDLRNTIINYFEKNGIKINEKLRTEDFNILFSIENNEDTIFSIDQIEYLYSDFSFDVGLKKNFSYKTLIIKLKITKIDYNDEKLIIEDAILIA